LVELATFLTIAVGVLTAVSGQRSELSAELPPVGALGGGSPNPESPLAAVDEASGLTDVEN
jgi:hypothetical protein